MRRLSRKLFAHLVPPAVCGAASCRIPVAIRTGPPRFSGAVRETVAVGARTPSFTVSPVRVLVIDNYDSFTYNLVQYLGELGAELEVVRNDHATVDELLVRGYDRVIVSPGPCTPNEAGISLEAVRRFPEARVPDARRVPRPPGARPGVGRDGDPARARARQDDDGRARRPDDLPDAAVAARGRALSLAGRRPGAPRLPGADRVRRRGGDGRPPPRLPPRASSSTPSRS